MSLVHTVNDTITDLNVDNWLKVYVPHLSPRAQENYIATHITGLVTTATLGNFHLVKSQGSEPGNIAIDSC